MWAPNELHTGVHTVDSTAGASVNVTGKGGVAACMGDTGDPVLSGGTLVGLTSQSSQGGCLDTDETQTSTAVVVARVDDLATRVAQKTGATRITDFNGGAVEDIAVGDPMATVGGDTTAGLVRVVYGGGKGTVEITQDLDRVPGGSEPGDHFGNHLATVDYNEDGYTDLVVSADPGRRRPAPPSEAATPGPAGRAPAGPRAARPGRTGFSVRRGDLTALVVTVPPLSRPAPPGRRRPYARS